MARSVHAQGSSFVLPLGMLAGMTRSGSASATHPLHIVVELQPKDGSLESAALAAVDPISPSHRAYLSADAFVARYGRSTSDLATVASLFRANGARDVYVSRNRLVVGATMTIAQAEHAFHTRFGEFVVPGRTAFAPVQPLTLPVAGVRAVRGVVGVTIPRLADVPKFTDFRGNWYVPTRFRSAYDATNEGGDGQHITLIEAAADRLLPADIAALIDGFGAPPGANASRIQTGGDTAAAQSTICGRDDRGQEPTVDADAILTMAPLAQVDLHYEDVCEQGDEGVLALQRALDATTPPTVIAFPFVVAPLFGTSRDAFGPPPIPYLEAALRGIPIVVPAGDDGAYGMRLVGMDRAAVTYPCVLPFVICAGGTELGDRSGVIDEGPWNDGTYATGGGISADPRPSWQIENEGFEFSPDFVKNRIVPDVSADAAGHLMTYWHGYEAGGVGGTSESTAIVAAQLAAINAQVPPAHRLISAGDLYVLAKAAPQAFRDVVNGNDRGYDDNTLRPRGLPLPLDYKGIIPTPRPLARGCAPAQANGCTVRTGYDAVTGIGSLREQSAINALR